MGGVLLLVVVGWGGVSKNLVKPWAFPEKMGSKYLFWSEIWPKHYHALFEAKVPLGPLKDWNETTKNFL